MFYPKRSRRRRRGKLVILLLVLVLIGGGTYTFTKVRDRQSQHQEQVTTKTEARTNDQPQLTPLPRVQKEVEEWVNQNAGTYGIMVQDVAMDTELASYHADEAFFSASIYKLYVAYIGYQKVQDGTFKMDEPYYGDFSRGKCLDEMLRSSHIPCGEKMARELGSDEIMEYLKNYGLKNTTFSGAYATTSARDAVIVLQRLAKKRDLTNEHTDLMLDSLKNQPALYRRGLPSGLPNATVYDKVGWNEQVEWHDTALVELPNGRRVVAVIMTRRAGMKRVADLAKTMFAPLLATAE